MNDVHPELTERDLAQMLKTWGELNEQARRLFGKDFADDFAAALVVSEQQKKRLDEVVEAAKQVAEHFPFSAYHRRLRAALASLAALSPSTPEENK